MLIFGRMSIVFAILSLSMPISCQSMSSELTPSFLYAILIDMPDLSMVADARRASGEDRTSPGHPSYPTDAPRDVRLQQCPPVLDRPNGPRSLGRDQIEDEV